MASDKLVRANTLETGLSADALVFFCTCLCIYWLRLYHDVYNINSYTDHSRRQQAVVYLPSPNLCLSYLLLSVFPLSFPFLSSSTSPPLYVQVQSPPGPLNRSCQSYQRSPLPPGHLGYLCSLHSSSTPSFSGVTMLQASSA